MIQLFNVNNHTIDTSEFSNLLHDKIVTDFEKEFASYVGAKYACSVNSATNAIFLCMLNKNTVVKIPSMIPPVVANAIITSGNKVEFYDDTDWVGHSYVLHTFEDYKIVDSAQKLEPNDLMIFSHYPTKPLGGADGGIVVTDDYKKHKWMKEAVLNGMTYADNNWERGISFPGYKFYMSSIQAKIIMDNFKNFDKKMRSLGNLVDIYRIEVLDNEKFIENMKRDGIICGIHYPALHQNPIYGKKITKLSKSEKSQRRTVSLPMNEKLSFNETEYIIDKVKENM